MKKILLSLAMALAVAPAFATDYTDNLVVTVNGNAAPAQTTTISVDKNTNGTYKFSLKNFKFGQLNLGDITMDNVEPIQDNGIVYLDTTEQVGVKMFGKLPVTLRAELRNNEEKMYASMDIYVALLKQSVNVTFGSINLQLPNSGFEDYQDYTENLIDMTTYEPTPTTVQEAIGWHSFASASGEYQQAATAFANPYTWKSSITRPGSTGKSSLMITSSNVMGFQIANGTVTTGRMNCGSTQADDKLNHAELVINDSVDAHGDPYYASLDGQPDSLVLWYAFKQGTPVAEHPYATVNAIITDGTYYQDPEDVAYTNKRSQAQNNKIATTFTNGTPVWKRLSIPFKIIDDKVNTKAILVTISTNADPGAGSVDTLYVDDIQLVYKDPDSTTVKIDWGDGTSNDLVSQKAKAEGTALTILNPNDIKVTSDVVSLNVVKSLKQDGDNLDAKVIVYNANLSKKIAEFTHTYKNTTGINDIHPAVNTSDKVVEVYDLSGRRVSNDSKGGIFIVKTADGKTFKVAK